MSAHLLSNSLLIASLSCYIVCITGSVVKLRVNKYRIELQEGIVKILVTYFYTGKLLHLSDFPSASCVFFFFTKLSVL